MTLTDQPNGAMESRERLRLYVLEVSDSAVSHKSSFRCTHIDVLRSDDEQELDDKVNDAPRAVAIE